MSYYTRLRPFYLSTPSQRFRHLVLALRETRSVLQQPIQNLRELAPLEDKNRVTDTHRICEIMREAVERIADDISFAQISPDTVTTEDLHALRFDLYTRVACIGGCVTVLKGIVSQDKVPGQAHYDKIIVQLIEATKDLRDVVDALFNPQEHSPD